MTPQSLHLDLAFLASIDERAGLALPPPFELLGATAGELLEEPTPLPLPLPLGLGLRFMKLRTTSRASDVLDRVRAASSKAA